jgi:SWIM/SEC-C metal-binding protein
MAKLGSKQNPAIVKVTSEERASEILSLCNSRGWQVIIGFENEENTDDIEKLLNPPPPAISTKVDRNAPCPCGSGKKSKKCCYSNS